MFETIDDLSVGQDMATYWLAAGEEATVEDCLPAEVIVATAGAEPPGPRAMGWLAAVDPRELPPDARFELLIGLERQAAWLAAMQQRVLACVESGPPGHPDEDWTREEVAAALRLSAATADRRLTVARTLDGLLTSTWQALANGQITYYHAVAIVEATDNLDDQTAAEVERKALGRAAEQTLAQLRRSLRRAVITADPAAAERAHQRAAAERNVELWPAEDGMAELRTVLPAPDATEVFNGLDALARRAAPDDPRPLGARRADALVELVRNALADSAPRTGSGPRAGRAGRPDIQVVVPIDSLVGQTDRPAELIGYGPITAQTARRLAAEGIWRRLLTDRASGQLLDYGRRTYRPPVNLADHVVALDRTCRFPGCAKPAYACDLDHTIPWDPDNPEGGTTSSDNLTALCRHHHRAKHEGGWRVEHHPDDSCTWTSPTGRTYHVPASRQPPDG